MSIQATTIVIYYLLLIWPMRVFWAATMELWLAQTQGSYVKHRVLVMRSLPMTNILAATWPLTIWIAMAHNLHLLIHLWNTDDQPIQKGDTHEDD